MGEAATFGLPMGFSISTCGCPSRWAVAAVQPNPEQLFAAGYAACFERTLREVARTRKLPLTDARITARVTLNITDDKRYVLGAELRGNLAGVWEEDARALMHAAHQICPYSNSMRGNVDVRLLLETDAVPLALASSHADGGN